MIGEKYKLSPREDSIEIVPQQGMSLGTIYILP